ncbi:MarR family winged helix-turn-helix transcriptional regulator [Bradyrhizobium liaoningense]|uniref:MarR family winged helix-turn-helix transcriptional regulator n=1 Tax=Bradyrhizobium liaoningense TaxID=43992 RepID=UPI001BA623C9|nr:MarR family winged helix-turn-helix transcriptional regulator [Bradyrhizobium liaoningense]MBR0823769.1 winged helix-turn-helix transcriptional regulator [Bradyrhizobium liaoningense]
MEAAVAAQSNSQVGYRCHCTALRKASRRVSQLYDAALAPCGLKATQRAILTQIARSEPAAIGLLAEALVMDSGGLAHTLKPLIRDGLVTMKVNPDDRRNRLVSLTAVGRARVKQSDRLWGEAQRAFEKSFGTARSRALRDAIDLLISDQFTSNFESAAAAD